MLSKNLVAVLAAVLLTAQLPLLGAQFSHRSKPSILDVLKADPELTTLVAALEASGIDATLDDANLKATLLAPTDAAFGVLLEELGVTAEELLGNTALLEQVLTLHLIPDERLRAADLAGRDTVTTAAGAPLDVITDDGVTFVGPAGPPGSNVVKADIGNCKGVVHKIDRVILPAPDAPQDPAQSGRRRLAQEEEAAVEEACSTIAQVAADNGLSTLAAALGAAGLTETVEDPDFKATVLAPTEEAFATLLVNLDMTAEELLADVDTLTSVLQLHIIPDEKYSAADLQGVESVPTLLQDDEGNAVELAVTNPDGGVAFTSPGEAVPPPVTANVAVADVDACAAMVHVIDAVLTP